MIRFPNEPSSYREARDELLRSELELRQKLTEVAAQRRALPLGGSPPEDYVFEEVTGDGLNEVRLSELFADGKDSLFVYSYMFAPDAEQPCPMCTSFLDGLSRYARHIRQRLNLAVVGKAPAQKLRDWADGRQWGHDFRLLSSQHNSYNRDYHGESEDGMQMPIANVFVKRDDGIRHFYGSEVLYAQIDGQPRHVDLLWPIWNFFDLTPEGRGEDWYPQLAYPDETSHT